MRKLILAIFTLGVAGLLVMIATPSMAVHKNYNNQLVCGGCHTMHNSQGNDGLGGPTGGAIVLLRGDVTDRKDIHNLCLQCHSSDGAQADLEWDGHTAPKVNIFGAAGDGNDFSGLDSDVTNDDFGKIGAGGDFSAVMSVSGTGWVSTGDGAAGLGRGHSLGLASVTPPGATDGVISDFTCTSCHDPHGAYTSPTAEANVFRNLKLIPRGSGSTSITLNTAIRSYIGFGGCTDDSNWTNGYTPSGNSLFVWPLFTGTINWAAANTSECYSTGGRVNAYGVDEPGTDGISNWCATCHDSWHEEIITGNANPNGTDWNRHPVDNLLNDGSLTSGGGVRIVDTASYSISLTQNRALPVAYTGGQGVFYMKPAEENVNKVFCLSCHFAHGGPYYDNLRWDYLSAVDTGSQTANSISSITGCQLCHNR